MKKEQMKQLRKNLQRLLAKVRGFELKQYLLSFYLWLKKVSLSRNLSCFFALASLVSGIATFVAFMLPKAPEPKTVLLLLNLDLVLLVLLTLMLGRGVLKVWGEKRQGSIGSGLQVRFVLLFLLITAMPTILVTSFSAFFFSVGMQAWFGDQVYNAVKESRNVAEAYFAEHSRAVKTDAARIMYSIDYIKMDPISLEKTLEQNLSSPGIDEAIIFDRSGKILAKAGFLFALTSEEVPFGALDRADAGEIVIVTGKNRDWIKALARIPGSIFYLYVGRIVDPSVLGHIERATIAVENYESLEGQRGAMELRFTAIFIVVSLLLMLVSAWIGSIFASRISKPVVGLIDASDRIRKGDFSIRVKEPKHKDELSLLTRAFNRMIEEISTTNKELDERMGFIETVLAGVSAGVIGTDSKLRIKISNRAANDFLGKDFAKEKGSLLPELIPELKEIAQTIKENPKRSAGAEIKIYNSGTLHILQVRVVGEYRSHLLEGFVFTFDDITDLQSAQRKAAWADVARRIAHEIKNPLTPIQLAAERLKHKYSPEIKNNIEDFDICTETIIRHVEDIGHMVDEFSAFARMPAPIMKKNNIKNIVNQAIFLQKTANSFIDFRADIPSEPVLMYCDALQISQVVTNVLKNAVEAIKDKGEIKGKIHIYLEQRNNKDIYLRIEDNGKGLPHDEKRDTITEPYVTTKAKGTGLGLAIVKKIMEDHSGVLRLGDSSLGGAMVTLYFMHREQDDS